MSSEEGKEFSQLEREMLQDSYAELFKKQLHRIEHCIGNSIYPNFKRLDELRFEGDKIYERWKQSYER